MFASRGLEPVEIQVGSADMAYSTYWIFSLSAPATQVVENSAQKAGNEVKVYPDNVFNGELKI